MALMTRTIPTDKYGHIYYGPTTTIEAVERIYAGQPAEEVAANLIDAGYVGVAQRIKKRFFGGVMWYDRDK